MTKIYNLIESYTPLSHLELTSTLELADAIIIPVQKIDSYREYWGNKKLIVVSDLTAEENIQHILNSQLFHLIGANSPQLNNEINETIEFITKGIKWGLECYLPPEADILSHGINNNREITPTIEDFLGQLDFGEYFSSPADHLRLMANELLTNALYNATLHRETMFKRDAIDRKENVTLKGAEHVLFKMGTGLGKIGLAVQDSFGGLDHLDLIKSLARGQKEKTPLLKEGGAGLGMYLVYNNSNQFIINVRPGSRTEVICLIDANKRFKHYKQRITSFHFYQDEV